MKFNFSRLTVLALLVALACPMRLSARGRSLPNDLVFRPGNVVTVTLFTGEHFTGTVVRLNSETLTLNVTDTLRVVSLQQISQVSKHRHLIVWITVAAAAVVIVLLAKECFYAC